MLAKFLSFFDRNPSAGSAAPDKSAAAGLPVIVPPKVPNKQQAQASASKRTKTTVGDTKLAATDRRTANTDLLTLRNGTSTKSTIHDLAKVSPDLSASVYAYQRLVVTRGFSAVARNLDGTVEPTATNLVQQLLSRFNFLTDYTDGFSGMSSIHAVGEALALELRQYGSCAMELALDKARVPNRLVPISTTQIVFVEDNTGYIYPIQKSNGIEINLDTPAFFYEALDQDLLTAYSDSPMEASLQAVIADTTLRNDISRAIRRALHPRLNVVIDSELFKKSIPMDIRDDPDKVRAYTENYISAVESTVNGLEPDDALIAFSEITFSYLNGGNVTLGKEYETLQSMINSKLATGTKAPPAVLGHGSGSQNIASTETLLFLRYCEGIQNKINSIISRALTLACRLLGQDVYVQFEFDRIDLRPDSELEAFKVMKQSRVLDQLSLGLISDEEAAIALTGRLPSTGSPKLSGTFFRQGAGSDPAAAAQVNPNTNTGTNSQGPQDMRPATPTQPKGPPAKGK